MSLPNLAKTTQRPLEELSGRQRAVLGALVHGLSGKMAEKYGVKPGQALNQYEAAAVFKVRRAYVRDLIADPVFRSEMLTQLAHKRLGLMPEALDRITTVMRSDNDPVALRASETILGDHVGASRSQTAININNTNNTNLAFRPGYVIRLRESDTSSPTSEGDKA